MQSQATQHMRLSELAAKVRGVIQDAFSGQFYWVVAEISGHKFYKDSNRHYLDLVEKIEGQNVEAAKIKTTAWAEGAKSIIAFESATGQKFSDGLQVLVKVKVEYHIIYGLSLVISEIDQSFTLGNLERQRLNTLMRLVKENPGKIYLEGDQYITSNKLLQLNKVLQRIALVASPNSEGYHDFMSNIRNNKFGYVFQIDNYFTTVQGTFAEEELKNTMIRIYETKQDYDCVVIIRGGGAKTDFLAFDTYGIARAVARFPFPVITGIGHLRDVSITDLMAHTATNAPTKAAEFIIGHNRMFEEEMYRLQRNAIIKAQQKVSLAHQKIAAINNAVINKSRTIIAKLTDAIVKSNRVISTKSISIIGRNKERMAHVHQSVINKSRTIVQNRKDILMRLAVQASSTPVLKLQSKRNELANLVSNIRSFTVMFAKNRAAELEHHRTVIKMMSPKNILRKGFAMVKLDGKVVKDASGIEEGKELTLSLSDAEIKTKVISKKDLNGNEDEL